jgi:hypothetical protein
MYSSIFNTSGAFSILESLSKWVPHFLDDDLRAKRLEGA